MKFIISQVLLCLSFSTIHAIPQRPSLTHPNLPNFSSPDAISANISQGYAPPTPAGFRTKITSIDTKSINPIHLYLLAFLYFYSKGEYGWDVPFPNEGPMIRTRLDASIYVHKPPKSGSYFLKTGDVLRGLYNGVVAMADGNFHPTSVEIFMFEQLIGTIYITKRSTTNSPSNDRMLPRRQDDDAKTIGPRSSPSNISDLEDGGRYIDPNRNDCSIVYEWSSGKIDSKDIFTTIMEAMIIVAYDGTHVPFDALNAVSASGNCAMNIHKTPGIPDQPSGFKATTLLFLLPNLIVQQRRFQGLDFSFEFGAPGTPQKSIFQGFIMGLGSPKDQSYSKVAATS